MTQRERELNSVCSSHFEIKRVDPSCCVFTKSFPLYLIFTSQESLLKNGIGRKNKDIK